MRPGVFISGSLWLADIGFGIDADPVDDCAALIRLSTAAVFQEIGQQLTDAFKIGGVAHDAAASGAPNKAGGEQYAKIGRHGVLSYAQLLADFAGWQTLFARPHEKAEGGKSCVLAESGQRVDGLAWVH